MNKKAKAQEVIDKGGLLLEELGEGVHVHLAIDPANPNKIFDQLNDLEILMVKRAGNSLENVKKAGEFVDDIRSKVRQILSEKAHE